MSETSKARAFPSESHPPLTLAVLGTLAENNPELESIWIYIDVMVDDFSKRTPRVFNNLERLSINHSPISLPAVDVATYLSHIISTPEVLEVEYLEDETYNFINDRNKKWDEVGCELERIMLEDKR